MKIKQLSLLLPIASILSVNGCVSSDSGSSGVTGASGGTPSNGSGGAATTGGATQSVTGGATGTSVPTGSGGKATGGTLATGGTTSNPATGGATTAQATGGTAVGAGGLGTGGKGANNTGGAVSASGGATGGSSSATGGLSGTAAGGTKPTGGTTGVATGGQTATGGVTVTATGGSTSTGPCTSTASKAANVNVSGSGTHKVTVETNTDTGISQGTIYRPTDLGGTEKYPIFVWGNGACSTNGLSNTAAMGEIASHGYFVIADGAPNGSGSRAMTTDYVSMGKPLLAYVTWAIAENEKPCSAYYHSLDTTKIAANGFSCGGLMSAGTAGDSRITTWGITSSGLTGPDQTFYKSVHTPVLVILGGTSDIAYNNGERDYTSISALGLPIMLFSKNIGHGGDLGSTRGGDFTKINLAWLNWWLKGDSTATGKGLLVGSGCTYCTNSAWEVKSANLP